MKLVLIYQSFFSLQMDPHRLAAIGWTGIITTVVAIYLEGIALETASATEAALLFASEPVWASLFGAWLLHESLNLNAYVGGAVILAACVLSAVSDLPQSDDKDAIDVEAESS
jgi:drug/metabolite transporter (DMT)-like permease